MSKQSVLVAHLFLFSVALIYAANFTIAKQVMPAYLQPFAFIALRVTAASLLFWISWLIWVREPIRREDIPRLIACGLTGVAINQLLFFKGLNLTTPIHGALIMLTTPILVLIMSAIWLREKMTMTKAVGVALGLGGATALIMGRGSAASSYAPDPLLGDLFIGINAVSYGIYLIIIKPLMQRYHPFTLMATTFSFGWLVVMPFSISELQATEWQSFLPSTWWAIAFVLFFVTYMAYLLNAAAMRTVSPSIASMYIYWQPPLTATIAIAAGKDELSLVVVLAAMAIGLGVYLVGRRSLVSRRSQVAGLKSPESEEPEPNDLRPATCDLRPTSDLRPKLTILGGGITGLVAAYLAARSGRRVTVLEAGDSLGGLLNTFSMNGEPLEYFYHHFFTHDAEPHWLLRELKIDDQVFFRPTSMGVFREGKIYGFNGVGDLLRFRPIRLLDKLRFGATSYYLGKFADWRRCEGVSCSNWLRRRAGASTAAALWMPMLRIKFGPYAERVPLAWMVGRMRQRLGSRSRGEQLGYLRGGLQTLLDALLQALRAQGVQLVTRAAVRGIVVEDNRIVALETEQGRFDGDQFLATIPGIFLAPLLHDSAPRLARQLSAIPYFGAVCVVLELNRPLSSVYWLNVADEGFPFGGIIEHTNFVSPETYGGSHIAYLSRYFAWEEEIATMSNAQIEELMLAQLPRIYPDFSRDWIKKVYVFKTKTAAVVCDLHFSKKVPPVASTELPNLFVANMAHIYPDDRGVNNSIRLMAEICRLMGIPAEDVPKGQSLVEVRGNP